MKSAFFNITQLYQEIKEYTSSTNKLKNFDPNEYHGKYTRRYRYTLLLPTQTYTT